MENSVSAALGMRVKALRKISKLSQANVAEKIGITLHYYILFEDDRLQLEASTIKKLSDLFGEDLLNIESDIVLRDENAELTKILVKKDRQIFIYNFIKEFVKLEDSAQDLVAQLIKDIEKS